MGTHARCLGNLGDLGVPTERRSFFSHSPQKPPACDSLFNADSITPIDIDEDSRSLRVTGYCQNSSAPDTIVSALNDNPCWLGNVGIDVLPAIEELLEILENCSIERMPGLDMLDCVPWHENQSLRRADSVTDDHPFPWDRLWLTLSMICVLARCAGEFDRHIRRSPDNRRMVPWPRKGAYV